jgi:hypothetical protein
VTIQQFGKSNQEHAKALAAGQGVACLRSFSKQKVHALQKN